MKAYAIVLEDHDTSNAGWGRLEITSKHVKNDFEILKFKAKTPIDAHNELSKLSTSSIWSWPWEGEEYDFSTGIKKVAYPTRNPHARVACFLSHYALWEKCIVDDEPYLILEHDAMFIEKFNLEDILPSSALDDAWIIGINDPRGATRRAHIFHDQIKKSTFKIMPVPRVDDHNIAQGLAGNSAYVITPKAAKRVIEMVKKIGMWPNDALLCYQLFPFLRVTTTYYTRVQGLPSTTST